MNRAAVLKIGLFMLLLVAVARYCDRQAVSPGDAPVLGPGDRARVIVRGRTVTTITPTGVVSEYAPGGVDIRARKDGDIDVRVKRFGLSREPGLGLSWNGDRLKLVIDLRLAYSGRAGLHLGLALDPSRLSLRDIARPLAFVSYAIPHEFFANTNLWIGAELLPTKYACGLRLAF